jgi:uncharacterized protein involved in type VI secretion and phage assembly
MSSPRKPRVPSRARRRFLGKHRGVVVNNLDPLSQGRLQVNVPGVLGDAVSNWALPCAPYEGLGVGFFMLPPVGAGVWVEFEAGDASRPIWVGGWWGAAEVPLSPTGAGNSSVKILRTDTCLLAFDDAGQTISISDTGGQNQLVVDITKGIVTLKSATRLVLNAPRIHEGSDSAAHPAVLGDQILNYLNGLVVAFNAHTHEVSVPATVVSTPPTPLLFPPSVNMISSKVMLE